MDRVASRSLKARGLEGPNLVTSDPHTGLRAAIARLFDATRQRGRKPTVHWMSNALAHVPQARHAVVAAAIRQAFMQPDQKGAQEVWRHIVAQLRPRRPKLTTSVDDGDDDMLPYMAPPAQHRTKPHSTNPPARPNEEAKRPAEVGGIFPDKDGILHPIGAVPFERDDDWPSRHRYVRIEAFGLIDTAQIDSLPSNLDTGRLIDVLEWTSPKLHQLDGR